MNNKIKLSKENEKKEKTHKGISKKDKEKTIKISKNMLITLFFILGFSIGVVCGHFTLSQNNKAKGIDIGIKKARDIGKATITKLIYDYYKAMGADIDSSSLRVEINKIEQNGSFYNIYFKINGKKYPQPIYLTEDGKSAYLQRINTVEHFELPKPKISKSNYPNVSINVMSFCPYGNQAENALLPVIERLSKNVKFIPHYIIYKNGNHIGGIKINGDTYWSLHGNKELQQDVREKIIYYLYGVKKWIEYVTKVNNNCNLNNIDTCWKEIAKNMSLDINKIEKVYNTKFDKIVLEEYRNTSAKNIMGSPTILINNNKYKGDRTPEAFKKAICDAFINPPEECNISLSENESGASGYCE